MIFHSTIFWTEIKTFATVQQTHIHLALQVVEERNALQFIMSHNKNCANKLYLSNHDAMLSSSQGMKVMKFINNFFQKNKHRNAEIKTNILKHTYRQCYLSWP